MNKTEMNENAGSPHKCGTCKHFTYAGDWDLCCMKSKRRLCYKNDDACEEWEEAEIKHTYWVVRDNEVIAIYKDHEGIHPVAAITDMARELSERMEKEAQARGELDDE